MEEIPNEEQTNKTQYEEPMLSDAVDGYLLKHGFSTESMVKVANVLKMFDAIVTTAMAYAVSELDGRLESDTDCDVQSGAIILRLPPRRDDYPHPDSA